MEFKCEAEFSTSNRDGPTLSHTLSCGIQHFESPCTRFRRYWERRTGADCLLEGLVVVVVSALLRRDAQRSSGCVKRAPVCLWLVTPVAKIISWPLACENRLRLRVCCRRNVTTKIAIDAELTGIDVIQLAGRNMAVSAAFMPQRDCEACISAPRRQINEIHLGIDNSDCPKR